MILPQHILKLVSAEDRKRMGKAGRLASETLAKGEAKSEKCLQRDIINLLRLKGIEVIVSRMDRKTSNNVGTPDLLFAVIGYGYAGSLVGYANRIYACAWEVKMPGKHLDEAQRNMRKAIMASPNHWTHRVIHSVDEALKELGEMGIE